MTKDEITARLIAMAQHGDLHRTDNAALTPDTRLRDDMGVDSLGVVEVMLACEDEWPGTHFGEDDTGVFYGSFSEIAGLVASRL